MAQFTTKDLKQFCVDPLTNQDLLAAMAHVEYLLDDGRACEDEDCVQCLSIINLLSQLQRKIKRGSKK